MSNVLDQVVNDVTDLNVGGSSTTLFDIAQVPASTEWLIHSNLWTRIEAGTDPGNITSVAFWVTSSGDVKLWQIESGALPSLWANNELDPLNKFVLRDQQKLRAEVVHTGNASVEIQTIITAVVIT